MRPTTISAPIGLLLLSSVVLSAGQDTTSLVPKGWYLRSVFPQNYRVGVDHQIIHDGKGAGYIQYAVDPMVAHPQRGPAFLCTLFKADTYRGHRIRVTAYANGDKLDEGAFLWISLDGESGTQPRRVGLLPGLMKRPVDWTKHECGLDVPSSMNLITIGVALSGRGTIWLDDVSIEIVGPKVPLAGIDGKGPASPKELNLGDPSPEPSNLRFEQ
jgi:hypothetical protein